MDTIALILIMALLVIAVVTDNKHKSFYYYKRIKTKRGECEDMINMLNDLVGKTIKLRDVILGYQYEGQLVEVNEKWIKLKIEKSKKTTYKIIAVDSIGTIDYD